MQQHPLIHTGDTEYLGDLGGTQPFDVTQDHDLALSVGQRGKEVAHPARSRSATSRSSTCSDHGAGGGDHAPEPSKRSSSSPPGKDVVRCSRPAVERARFRRVWNNHVVNDDRPSKRSTPRITASQVSSTTSSATERLTTTDSAQRSNRDWYFSTSATKAASSPALRRTTSCASSSIARNSRRRPFADPWRVRRSESEPHVEGEDLLVWSQSAGARSGAVANSITPSSKGTEASNPSSRRARSGEATTWRTSPSRYWPVTTGARSPSA